MLLAAIAALPQCAAGQPAWDMALPIQIIATSEVPEVERWHAALRLGINELGGTATTRRAQQQIWLTTATYGWCDPILDGMYVMYTMEVDGAGTSAIFMCWNVIANGSWSDVTIARFMRHALGHVLARRFADLPCSAMTSLPSLSCAAPDHFVTADLEFICDSGNVRSDVCSE